MKLTLLPIFSLILFLVGCQNAQVAGPRIYGPPPAPENYSGSSRDMSPTKFRILGVSGSISGDTVTVTNQMQEMIAVDSGFYDELFYIAPNGSFLVDLAKTRATGPDGYAVLTFYRFGPNREPIVISTERFALSGRSARIYQHICTIQRHGNRIYVSKR